MEIVFWICGIAGLLAMLAYAIIGAALLAAKYRMTRVPSCMQAPSSGRPIADLRLQTR
jgi:hypothetical protein